MKPESISPQMLGRSAATMSLLTGAPTMDGKAAAGPPPLRRLMRFASRWRWLLLGGVGLGALFGGVLTLVLPHEYTATSRLQISRAAARVVNIDSVERDTSIGDQEFYQTQYGLLRTRVLAERVARDLGLVDDPGFFKMFGRGDLLRGGESVPSPTMRAKRNEAAGKILLLHVGVAPVRGSSLVDVSAVTPDPALSQKIAQTWSEDYITSNLERRYDESSYARRFLEARLGQLREKLEASERDAVEYAATQGIISLPSPGDSQTNGAGDDRSLFTDDLTSLNAALDTATAERIQAQSRLRDVDRSDASNEALGNQAIGLLRQKRAEADSEYEKLLVQFEPNYPQAKALASQVKALDAAIAQEEERVKTSLVQSYASASAREQALTARVNGLKHSLSDYHRRSIQYNIYEREAQTNRELYDAILQRYKEIGVAGAIENNNVSIVDPAKQPDRPSSPRLLVDLLLSILAGAILAAAAAAGLEQIDEGIADPTEVAEKLGLPLLGIAPREKTGNTLDALKSPRSKLVEAYLAVQANLELSTAHGVPRSLAVVSTRSREGKSTTAIALARSLARARRTVVLVDADLRSPTVHTAFGLANVAGVSNFLSGADDIDASIHDSGQNGLSIMTAGPQPPNSADLLMGERLTSLIRQLQGRFDHVVVDSPPVLGLADAPLVAAAVEGVIFAVEARAAPVGAVRLSLGRIRSMHVHVLGAVLTKFDAKRAHLGYGYGYDDYAYGR